MMLKDGAKLHKKRDDSGSRSGMVTVEVVISFTLFITVVAGIIYFTNIFIVHNKVQFAINSAAHEIAAYTYLYEALGGRDMEKTFEKDMGKYADNLDDTVTQVTETMNDISDLYDSGSKLVDDASNVKLDPEYIAQLQANAEKVEEQGGKAYDAGKVSVEKIKGHFEDPNGTVVGIIYMAVDGASYYVKSLGARLAAEAMTKKYLKQGDRSADQFLKGYGVKDGYDGLDFSGSTMFCDPDYRMIDIVVEYDIHVGFLGLILSDPTVHMVQRVSVSAWVGDNGMWRHSAYLNGKSVKKDNAKEEQKEELKEDPRGAELNAKNFPDDSFRKLAKSYDKDNDGFLSKEETKGVEKLLVHRSNYTSFKGIENFSDLTWVNPFSNPITDPIDLSKNTKLKHADLPCTNTDFYDLTNCEPIREMIESGDYKTMKYNYWGDGTPCVEFYNKKGVELYIQRTGQDVIVGDYRFNQETCSFEKFK